MNLKKLNSIEIVGDISYRGDCPSENAEQVTFFNWIRKEYPTTLGLIAIHPRNEGKRTYGQANWQKAEGMNTGAADIVIPCSPPIVIELKRRDHTKSTISKEQIEFLEACQSMGGKVCVALGWEAAKEFVATHIPSNTSLPNN